MSLEPLNSPDALTTASQPTVTVVGPWQVAVSLGGLAQSGSAGTVEVRGISLDVEPLTEVVVHDELHSSLPVFTAWAGGWAKGARLSGVATQETTAMGLLVPGSVVVAPDPDSDQAFVPGLDYVADDDWGTVGRLPEGNIAENAAVFISYRYVPNRLDAIVVNRQGGVRLLTGVPASNECAAPLPDHDEVRLANLWLSDRATRLTPNQVLPVSESEATVPRDEPLWVGREHLAGALAKLENGEPLRILAWGDSVTDGGYLPSPEGRWQVQFVARLRLHFPQARIELITEAWAGRTTGAYLAEPSGAEHNYREKVLDARPDLIISEFVNDAGLSPAEVDERYGQLLADFEAMGASWVILTPHYVMPSWMDLDRQVDIDADPRPYVAALRRFASGHPIALADASRLWGRLWRQGIPYTTLLSNQINHPNAAGMKLFADALMQLFLGL